MKYDDAEYYFLNFTTDLPNEAGGRHIGLFLEWAILRGFASDELQTYADALRRRETNGIDILFDVCDGKLNDEDLGAEGNAFAAEYYEQHHIADFATAMNVAADDEDPDAMFAAELTPQRHARVLWQLDRRYSDWRRRFGLPTKEALLERLLAAIAPAAAASGFSRVDPRRWGTREVVASFERSDAAGNQHFELVAVDTPEWFYGVRVDLSVHLEALYDVLYEEKRLDLGVVTSLQYAASVSFASIAQGWSGPVHDYLGRDYGFWIFRDEDIEPLAQWLATRLRDFALPLLRQLDSVAAVADGYATEPMSASPIHDARDGYPALLAAEMAAHPRLGAMLEETERALHALDRNINVLGEGCLRLIDRIRARRRLSPSGA